MSGSLWVYSFAVQKATSQRSWSEGLALELLLGKAQTLDPTAAVTASGGWEALHALCEYRCLGRKQQRGTLGRGVDTRSLPSRTAQAEQQFTQVPQTHGQVCAQSPSKPALTVRAAVSKMLWNCKQNVFLFIVITPSQPFFFAVCSILIRLLIFSTEACS